MSETVSYSVLDQCPYLPERESTIEIHGGVYSPESYEQLLPFGWRRSGFYFYRYSCSSCSHCIPLRVSAATLRINERWKRTLKKNSDLTIKISDPLPKEEYFLLYENYCRQRHKDTPIPSETDFRNLFSYTSCMIIEYRSKDGTLEGFSLLDILPSGLSSVYFAFNPESSGRSLGYYSVLREAAIAMESGREWYYLGFWVPGSRKMDYKADFSPFQIAPNPTQGWINVIDKNEALRSLER